jgi:hypothetical protein
MHIGSGYTQSNLLARLIGLGRIPTMGAFSALLQPPRIGSDWLDVLIGLCLLVVLTVTILITTAPFWGLGIIFWHWWRAGRLGYVGHPPRLMQRFLCFEGDRPAHSQVRASSAEGGERTYGN